MSEPLYVEVLSGPRGGGEGILPPFPYFGRSINQSQPGPGEDYAQQITACPPPLFSDLPTALSWLSSSHHLCLFFLCLGVLPNLQHSREEMSVYGCFALLYIELGMLFLAPNEERFLHCVTHYTRCRIFFLNFFKKMFVQG